MGDTPSPSLLLVSLHSETLPEHTRNTAVTGCGSTQCEVRAQSQTPRGTRSSWQQLQSWENRTQVLGDKGQLGFLIFIFSIPPRVRVLEITTLERGRVSLLRRVPKRLVCQMKMNSLTLCMGSGCCSVVTVFGKHEFCPGFCP